MASAAPPATVLGSAAPAPASMPVNSSSLATISVPASAIASAPAPAPVVASGSTASDTAPAAAPAAATAATVEAPQPSGDAPSHYQPGGAAVVWYAAPAAPGSGAGALEARVAAMESELASLVREHATRDEELRRRVSAALALLGSSQRDSAALHAELQELDRILQPAAPPPAISAAPAAQQLASAAPEVPEALAAPVAPEAAAAAGQHAVGLHFPPPRSPLPYPALSPLRFLPDLSAAPHAPAASPWPIHAADRGRGADAAGTEDLDGCGEPGPRAGVPSWQGFQGGFSGAAERPSAPTMHLRMWLDRVTSDKPFGDAAARPVGAR